MSFPQHFSAQFLPQPVGKRTFKNTPESSSSRGEKQPTKYTPRTESNRPGQRSIPGRGELFGASRGRLLVVVVLFFALSLALTLFSPVFRTTPSAQSALFYLDVFLGEIFPHQATAKSRLFFLFFHRGMSSFSTTLARALNVCVTMMMVGPIFVLFMLIFSSPKSNYIFSFFTFLLLRRL